MSVSRNIDGNAIVPFDRFFAKTASSRHRAVDKENLTAARGPASSASRLQRQLTQRIKIEKPVPPSTAERARFGFGSARRVIVRTPFTVYTPSRTPYSARPKLSPPSAQHLPAIRLFASPVQLSPVRASVEEMQPTASSDVAFMNMEQYSCWIQNHAGDMFVPDETLLSEELMLIEEDMLEREIRRDIQLMEIGASTIVVEFSTRTDDGVLDPVRHILNEMPPQIDETSAWQSMLKPVCSRASDTQPTPMTLTPPPAAPNLAEVLRSKNEALLSSVYIPSLPDSPF